MAKNLTSGAAHTSKNQLQRTYGTLYSRRYKNAFLAPDFDVNRPDIEEVLPVLRGSIDEPPAFANEPLYYNSDEILAWKRRVDKGSIKVGQRIKGYLRSGTMISRWESDRLVLFIAEGGILGFEKINEWMSEWDIAFYRNKARAFTNPHTHCVLRNRESGRIFESDINLRGKGSQKKVNMMDIRRYGIKVSLVFIDLLDMTVCDVEDFYLAGSCVTGLAEQLQEQVNEEYHIDELYSMCVRDNRSEKTPKDMIVEAEYKAILTSPIREATRKNYRAIAKKNGIMQKRDSELAG